MVPGYPAMGATISLKNIPEEIYDSLKRAASAHHRSINSEAVACLELVLLPGKTGNDGYRARTRQMRERLKGKKFLESA